MQQSVAHSFLDSVDRRRSSQAVVSPQGAWTYEELGGLAGSVSSYLGSIKVDRGDRIALLLPNSGEYIASFYGSHLAGCAVVALNLQEPAPVLARLLEHCDARVLFVDENYRDYKKLVGQIGSTDLHVVKVGLSQPPLSSATDDVWSQIRSASILDYRRHVVDTQSSDLAAIIYTSGTTGNPKGVMLSQRNLFANTESILEYLPISKLDRGFNVLPFYYSFGNSVMHTHMTAGACLVLQNHIAFPHAVLKMMANERATGFYGVPTTFALLFGKGRVGDNDLSSLRYVAQAGGPMPVPQQQQLAQDLPGVQIFVMYGQTEATARLTYLAPDHLFDKAGSVGKAISGVELRVGHSSDAMHTVDSPAEVYARGDNIMTGYWNDSQATNKVIRDGWLRTGDLGYFDHEGFLFLTGRSSDMIKTGANRVSPAEIEEIVGEFPEVAEVAAYAVPDELLGQAIAVAVIRRDGVAIDEQDIQRQCLELLSHYKIPKYVRFVPSLPKTSSGKLKRHVLAKDHEETNSCE
jgi:long-chain acyl-CoA synthetase